ncbi:MAG: DUF362 domain-containing protein [Candidatus Heimdallarchaeota archaeon]
MVLPDPLVSEVLHTQHSLRTTILSCLDPLGGLTNFIKPRDHVLVKPNFNTADPFPASTDLDFFITILMLLKEITSDVTVIESSTLKVDTRKLITSRMNGKLEELDVPLVTEKDYVYEKVDLKSMGAKYMKSVKLPRQILDPKTKTILLPCCKTHFIGQFTGALKLAVGLMERKQRIRMHMSLRVPEKVADLNLGYSPHLCIMDARTVFVTGGPSNGRKEEPQKILAGSNRVALDIQGIKIIQKYNAKNHLTGKSPEEVRQIARAIELDIDGSSLFTTNGPKMTAVPA